jgi:hypothetical protein
MFRSILFFAAIYSLATIPALADLINVSVNSTVSASGSVSAVCNPNDDTPGCMQGTPSLVTNQFSFSASDTQFGSFSRPWNAGTVAGGSVTPFADVNTAVCLAAPSMGCPPAAGDALYVELTGGHSGFAITYQTDETEIVTMSFQLTDPTDATLYSSSVPATAVNVNEILDSTGTKVLLNSDASTFLPPGSYELYVFESGGAFGNFSQSGSVTDSHLYLTAQFAPVPTPEPRTTSIAALLSAAICGFWVRRRRRIA